MSDQPTTVNQPAVIADEVLHALIFDVAVKSVEAQLVAAVPELGLPIISQLVDAAIQWLAGKIYEALAKGATFTIIDAQTSIEAKQANDAATALKGALAGGNPDEIDKAKKDFSDAFGKLVRLDGSAPV